MISDIMEKAAGLSDFDNSQIVAARRLETSISEMAHLVDCSRAVIVSIYRKWFMQGETTSRRPAVRHPLEH